MIIQALERFDQGRSVTEMIRSSNTSIREIVDNSTRLIAFVRQLTWLYLFEMIFKPFCFGLRPDMSQLMHKTIESICSQGSTLFHNTSLIHREKVRERAPDSSSRLSRNC